MKILVWLLSGKRGASIENFFKKMALAKYKFNLSVVEIQGLIGVVVSVVLDGSRLSVFGVGPELKSRP